jgi:hypothetical protein
VPTPLPRKLSLHPFIQGPLSEQQRDAPDGAKPHKGVDYAADRGGLSAEQPCDHIKAEQTYAAPVEAADNGEYQRDFIHILIAPFLFPHSYDGQNRAEYTQKLRIFTF